MAYPYNDSWLRPIDHRATYFKGVSCYTDIGNCYTGNMISDYVSINWLINQFMLKMVFPFEPNSDDAYQNYRLSISNKYTGHIIYCPSPLNSEGIMTNIAQFCFSGDTKLGIDDKPIIRILYRPRAFRVDMNLKSDPKHYLPIEKYNSDISKYKSTIIESLDNDL